MAEYTLTLLDTASIQKYIFRSNRLQENIGASEIVYRATTMWAFAALDNVVTHKHNVEQHDTINWQLSNKSVASPGDNIDAEVVYAGGGKTLIIFRDSSHAITFTKILTNRVLKSGAGLALLVRHVPIDWNSHSLAEKQKELFEEMEAHKQKRLPSLPLLGLGVTAACESTGLVAAQTDKLLKLPKQKERGDPPRLISTEIVRKLQNRNDAGLRLRKEIGLDQLQAGRDTNFEFPYEIDDLGRIEGEESYVAVIHIDGNRMGEHLKKIADTVQSTSIETGNCEYARKLRQFSKNVYEAGLQTLRRVVKTMVEKTQWEPEVKRYFTAKTVPLAENKWLPFRPLVYGGDDVTFVCNAQLALSLTAIYLKAFEEETAKLKFENMHACAGVAMVKMHYPFSRAYDLSEQLCKRAKSFVRKERKTDISALDWHFALSGLSGSLGEIRNREYTIGAKKLYLRPVGLEIAPNDQSGRYWNNGIENVIRDFQNGPNWKDRRNKVIGLRQVLREGPIATKEYRESYELPELPALLPGRQGVENGYRGNECVYFDALELVAHYVSLE